MGGGTIAQIKKQSKLKKIWSVWVFQAVLPPCDRDATAARVTVPIFLLWKPDFNETGTPVFRSELCDTRSARFFWKIDLYYSEFHNPYTITKRRGRIDQFFLIASKLKRLKLKHPNNGCYKYVINIGACEIIITVIMTMTKCMRNMRPLINIIR